MDDIPEIVLDISGNNISPNNKEPLETLRELLIRKDISTFANFLQNVRENFWGPRISNSLTLDLFAVYLNAQKILYIESKSYCEDLLNRIMLPAIFISLAVSVASLGLKTYEYGNLILSALSGFDAFLLAIISFTKLDAKAEAHKTSSYRFDKLQTKCEFYSGKVLLLELKKDAPEVTKDVSEFIETIEKQIDDIKDSNQFVIPESIRHRFPNTYSVNIFSVVKLLRNKEKIYFNTLHTIYNKLENERDLEKIYDLNYQKESTITDMIRLYDSYANLNTFINDEVNKHIIEQYNKYRCFNRKSQEKSHEKSDEKSHKGSSRNLVSNFLNLVKPSHK